MKNTSPTKSAESDQLFRLQVADAIDPKGTRIGVKEEIQTTRDSALLQTSAVAIQVLDAQGVAVVQGLLGHGFTFGRWQTPRKWSPMCSPSDLDIDLRGRILHFLPGVDQQVVRRADEALALSQAGAKLGERELGFAIWVCGTVEHAVLTLTRYLVLCRIGPAAMGRAKGRSLDPNSLRDMATKGMPPLLALGMAKVLNRQSGTDEDQRSTAPNAEPSASCLAHLEHDDLLRLTRNQQDLASIELQRMKMLADLNLWNKAPLRVERRKKYTSVSGSATPPVPERVPDEFIPLPHDYVAEMGRKSLWIIRELGPNLLTIARAMLEAWQRTEDTSISPAGVAGRRKSWLATYLQDYEWRDSVGGPLLYPPFKIRLSEFGKHSHRARNAQKENAGVPADAHSMAATPWPPRAFAQIQGLWGTLQRAHIFVVGISEGARKGEIGSHSRDCVTYAPGHGPFAEGKTFKLVDRHDGEDREWVLPDIAAEAIEQQSRLVQLAEAIGSLRPRRSASDATGVHSIESPNHLWGELGHNLNDARKPLINFNIALQAYARTLGMSAEPGGKHFHIHRFRKTLARIVALALTEAPKVLMDVFGHKTIEMTLHYILADKDLQAEIEQVSRELRVMKASTIIAEMVAAEEAQEAVVRAAASASNTVLTAPAPYGGYGGAAAKMISNAIAARRDRLHREGALWGANDTKELAEVLTLRGIAWQHVRPGVLCTKLDDEAGACNYRIGRAEPSRCRPHCKHRLNEAFLRADVDASIRDCVRAYSEAREKAQDLVAELWRGQVLAHLETFDDLRAKWIQHPVVGSLLSLSPERL